MDIDDKPFDEYIFVEKDQDRCIQLKLLKRNNKNIQIENEDANNFLQNLQNL